MNTPSDKRATQDSFVSFPPPQKKSVYLLDVTVIKKGSYPYYTIPLQNEATSVLHIVCYHTKVHQKPLQILQLGDPIKIELQPTSNDSVKFTSSCIVTPFLQIDVDFKLNNNLKLAIQMERVA